MKINEICTKLVRGKHPKAVDNYQLTAKIDISR